MDGNFHKSEWQKQSWGPELRRKPGQGDSVDSQHAMFPGNRKEIKVCQGQGSGKRITHKHKQTSGIVPGMDGWQNFVDVFFGGSFLLGEKTHKHNPQKILGQSRERFVYMSFSSLVFSLLNQDVGKGGVEFKESSLHECFGGFDGFGGSGEHLAA